MEMKLTSATLADDGRVRLRFSGANDASLHLSVTSAESASYTVGLVYDVSVGALYGQGIPNLAAVNAAQATRTDVFQMQHPDLPVDALKKGGATEPLSYTEWLALKKGGATEPLSYTEWLAQRDNIERS